MTCEICNWIEKKDVQIVYEDEKAMAVISPTPKAIGHMIVFPKKHYEYIDDIPKDIVSHLFFVSSFAATAVFEGLGAQGTNIISMDGPGSESNFDHFHIHIVPRKEGDSLDFKWEPKKEEAGKLDDTLKNIKTESCFIGQKEAPSSKKEHPKKEERKGPEPDVLKEDEEENYLIKQLRRIP